MKIKLQSLLACISDTLVRNASRAPGLKLFTLILGCAVLLVFSGCQTTKRHETDIKGPAQPVFEALQLREGDTLKISFPGAPNLNNTQQIRRDGKITLEMVGEVQAAGKMPTDLEKELLELYFSKLVLKEVLVTVQSANFSIFVTGQVNRPGKVLVDHPMTALEAIMESGGFNTWADLKNVAIIRQVPGGLEHFTLDLSKVMDGKSSEVFYLKPSDIVNVKMRIF